MIYGKAEVQNAAGAASSITLPQGSINGVWGYAATITDLQTATDIDATRYSVVGQAIQVTGAGDPTNCQVTYGPATSITTPPTYTELITGC
jgi:hypothetical protein